MSLLRLTALNGNDLLVQASAILYAERFASAVGRREPFTQISIKDHPPVQVVEDISDILAAIGPEGRSAFATQPIHGRPAPSTGRIPA